VHVAREVAPEVDAAHDQVRRLGARDPSAEDVVQSEVHTVRRGAAHREPAFPLLAHAQRLMHGQRVALGGPLGVRRDDPDLPDVAEGLGQGEQPDGVDAVVVGQEQAHVAGYPDVVREAG
jgi:hypothetical protein